MVNAVAYDPRGAIAINESTRQFGPAGLTHGRRDLSIQCQAPIQAPSFITVSHAEHQCDVVVGIGFHATVVPRQGPAFHAEYRQFDGRAGRPEKADLLDAAAEDFGIVLKCFQASTSEREVAEGAVHGRLPARRCLD